MTRPDTFYVQIRRQIAYEQDAAAAKTANAKNR